MAIQVGSRTRGDVPQGRYRRFGLMNVRPTLVARCEPHARFWKFPKALLEPRRYRELVSFPTLESSWGLVGQLPEARRFAHEERNPSRRMAGQPPRSAVGAAARALSVRATFLRSVGGNLDSTMGRQCFD
jgi:hypothetical protein